jgi:hypothetical protein
MKLMDYIKQDVVLYGNGRYDDMHLNAAFFKGIEQQFGIIKEVLPITVALGGTSLRCCNGYHGICGCFLKLYGGGVICIQSDNEYIDVCYAPGDIYD